LEPFLTFLHARARARTRCINLFGFCGQIVKDRKDFSIQNSGELKKLYFKKNGTEKYA